MNHVSEQQVLFSVCVSHRIKKILCLFVSMMYGWKSMSKSRLIRPLYEGILLFYHSDANSSF